MTPTTGIDDPILKAQLEAIQRRIGEQKAQGLAGAQGAAIARGLTGSTFEAQGMGKVEQQANQDLSDAAVNISVQQARIHQDEKRRQEDREFQARQAQLDREFQESQLNKQLGFQGNQAELNRSLAAKEGKLNTLGQVVGGVASVVGKIFCFDPFTLIEMADGSLKYIQEIGLDEETAGGIVESIRLSKTDDNIHLYNGILVTGHHAVYENGVWKRVKDTDAAIVQSGGTVCSITTSNHRIFAVSNNTKTMFADETETDMYEYLTLDQSLAALNEQNVLS